MENGMMRSFIVFQKQTTTVDSAGNHINAWNDYYTCRAYVNAVVSVATGESLTAGTTVTGEKLTFTVRYCENLSSLETTNMRIRFDGRIYNITSIDDYQFRHETLKITAGLETR